MWPHSKPKLPEMILFWSYLKHFLSAGLPLVLAFRELAKVLHKKPWPEILGTIELHLLSGQKLSHALSQAKDIFGIDVVEMIAIAEKKGDYPQVISMITEHLKWQLQTRQTIASALRYPSILLGVMGLLFYLVCQHIIPQLQGYLASLGIHELPLSTRLLLSFATVVPHVMAGVLGLGIISYLTLKLKVPNLESYRLFFQKQLLHLPGFGRLYDKLIMVTFIRVFTILLDSGVDVLISLHQAIKVVPNRWRAFQLQEGKNRLIQGEKLSIALRDVLKRHPTLGVLFDLGEQTGRLPMILAEYVEFEMAQFKIEVDRRIQSIQPVLIMIMGTILIWVIVSILLPMYAQIGNI
ncbi:type II secretion system F family protein [Candidatus Paracaedibacter symbiosus]|uniref:type II secretion system F family protein n=1 Tax=Candidatus Paracaedibacter symbiosus TaxID=244582 RepID=UPI0005099E20|nr:type II secretion system F family protein [Candidatus Paracaedibacter symbiosus]